MFHPVKANYFNLTVNSKSDNQNNRFYINKMTKCNTFAMNLRNIVNK